MEMIGREGGSSSKKLITNKRSMHAVEYNDDLLIEILLRLPVFSIVLFKSVCKRWLSLINDPSFSLRRNQIPTLDPPCGILHRVSCFAKAYDFLSLDTRIPYKQSALETPFPFQSELQYTDILQSSNGLFLCRGGINNDRYYIYNPCTDLFKMLPQCSNKTILYTRIAFDPTKSPHYKVIQIVFDDDDGYDCLLIQTYSSETRTWSFCSDQYPRKSFNGFVNGLYWNDAVYWVNRVITPYVIFRLDINVQHQSLTTQKPPGSLDSKVPFTNELKLFESRGRLLLLSPCDGRFSGQINVYEMRNGLSEWSIKYCVNLDDFTRAYPGTWNIYSRVVSIFLGESEEDWFMLIEVEGKLVQYKPMLKTSRDLCDMRLVGSTSAIFPFIASFASAGV